MADTAKGRLIKIGLVRDGKLVRESQLRPRTEATIGTDAGNTLAVRDARVGRRHVLLTPVADGYELNVLPGMTGKLSLEERVVDVEAIAKEKDAIKRGNATALRLTPNAKGKIAVGEDTILFQLLPAGAPIIAGKLPPDLRGGLIQTMDRRFAIALAVSFFIHALIVWLMHMIPAKPEIPLFETEVTIRTTDVYIPPPDLKQEEQKTDEGKGSKGPNKKGRGADIKAPPKPIESRGLLALIAKQSKNGNLAQIMSEGIGQDINEALKNVGGVQVAGAGMTPLRPGGGGGGGRAWDISGMGQFGPGKSVDLGGKRENRVSMVHEENPDVQGKLDRNLIAATVRKYLAGIKACYEYQLKRDPNLKGKINVRFTIGTEGAVTEVTILSSSLEDELVKSCVKRRIERWIFPKPEEGTVTVLYPFIFTAVSGG